MDDLDVKALLKLPVFNGVFEHNMEEMLGCLYTEQRTYSKGDVILNEAQYEAQIGLVLSGSVDISVQSGALARLSSPEMFGKGFFQRELLHCTDGMGAFQDDRAGTDWRHTAVAASECTVLLFQHEHVITPCWFSCFYHARFIDNAIRIAGAQNNKYL